MSAARVGIATDKRMLEHERPYPHPECPDRLRAIWKMLQTIGPFVEVKPREATDEELATCHDLDKILSQMEKLSENFENHGDCYVVPEKTLLAARIAAGCCIQIVQDIIAGRIESGFAVVRPPSHHAHCCHVSGFCYFNSALLAAVEASKTRRVLIIDFDVHANDGICEIMKSEKQRNNKNIANVSIHRYDNGHFYPGTGHPGTSCDGRILNIGFNGSKGDDYYDEVMDTQVLPFAHNFKPELIVVCAGFDAARGDPLGNCLVTPKGYANIMRKIQSITRNIAMTLEGGYQIDAITASAKACVRVLLQPKEGEKEREIVLDGEDEDEEEEEEDQK